jgi:hypothetical protein
VVNKNKPSYGQGTVIHILNPRYHNLTTRVGVQFDKPIPSGHDCSGAEPNHGYWRLGHCFWYTPQELEVVGHGEEIPPLKWLGGGKLKEVT